MNRATPTQTENAELLDQTMNDILKAGGEPLIDNEGKVQLDGNGNVIRRPLSAATLNAIRSRIRDLGINGLPVAGSPAGELARTAQQHGLKIDGQPIDPFTLKLPSVTDEDDAATA